jgi:hypothetical protein
LRHDLLKSLDRAPGNSRGTGLGEGKRRYGAAAAIQTKNLSPLDCFAILAITAIDNGDAVSIIEAKIWQTF